MPIIRFTNCGLIDNGKVKVDDLYVNQTTGKICDSTNSPDGVIDLNGCLLSPGFIDIQINGCWGFDFSHFESIEQYRRGLDKSLTKLLETGTTSICPTTTSNFSSVYHKVLPHLGRTRKSARCDSLGAHTEGPFINPKKKGCHPVKTLTCVKRGFKDVEQMYGKENVAKNIAIITAAPEVEGVLDVIQEMKTAGIVYSVGHTTADFETTFHAIEQGCTMVTHMYNAMPQPHHRTPGVTGTLGMRDNKPFFGIVADGIHVHPSAVNTAFKSSVDSICLVTDAMSLIGLKDGTYGWGDQFIVKKGSHLFLQGTDTIAGSGTDLPTCVRNLVEWTGCTLAEAVKTVTNNPSNSLGLQSSKGYLNVGCDADLCVLDTNGNLTQVFKLGVKVFDATEKEAIHAML